MSREWLTEAWLKAKALVNQRRLERDLAEELEFHLAKRAEKNRALGLAAPDAQTAARRQGAAGLPFRHYRSPRP